MNLHRDIESIPVLAKAGAIVPMARFQKRDNRLFNSSNMEVTVFPGADGSFILYEDSGDYETDDHVTTKLTLNWASGSFTIAPAQGNTSLVPEIRNWKINLRGFHKDAKITVNIPDAVLTRDDDCNSAVILVNAPTDQEICVTFTGENLIHDNSDVPDRCFRLLLHSQIATGHKEHIWKWVQMEERLHQKLYHMSA